jgi:hypothetical protein
LIEGGHAVLGKTPLRRILVEKKYGYVNVGAYGPLTHPQRLKYILGHKKVTRCLVVSDAASFRLR